MRIVFIGLLPEPITGQSLACRVLLDALRAENEVAVVDMAKSTFKQGVSSALRVVQVARVIVGAWRRRKWGEIIYFTIAESRAGNAKDLLIYLACFARLERMVIHLHGGAGLRVLLAANRPLTRAVNRFFLKRLGGVIVLGERHVEIFDGLVDRERIHIVPNFAEDELLTSEDAIDEKFRSVRPLRLLFLSNLLPGKGHLELVAAYASLAPSEREALAIDFAGGFESEPDGAEFARRIEPFPRLRYHGTVRGDAKRRMFAAAHVFCLPTYYPYEGQPISILEAYASGCAVVTTDHSGIFDIFEDGVNGLAVEKGSVVSLAAVLSRLIAAPEPLREVARTNLRTAAAQYRTEHFCTRVSAVLEEVKGRRSRRG